MYRIAQRYRGRIHSWEIWNEPDNQDYWRGSPAEFAELVRRAAVRIREADPQAVLVLGGMARGPSHFFRSLITGFHLERWVDVIAMHGYPETWGQERAEQVFRGRLPEMLRMISGSGDDFWVNEIGYADYRFSAAQASRYGVTIFYNYEHTPRYAAEFLFKSYAMSLAADKVSLTGWYRIEDFSGAQAQFSEDAVNYHLGLFTAEGEPKPAYRALTFFSRLLGMPVRHLPARARLSPGSQAELELFRRKDGELVVVGWLRSSRPCEVGDVDGMAHDARQEKVSLELPCRAASAPHFYGATGEELPATPRVSRRRLDDVVLRGDRVFIAELDCR